MISLFLNLDAYGTCTLITFLTQKSDTTLYSLDYGLNSSE